MSSIWFITGSSNGFGLLLSLRALKAGHRVIGTVRSRVKSAEAVAQIESAGGKVVELDMTEPQASITDKVQAAESIYGHIDFLVNNAGYSLLGPVEAFTEKEANLQIQTNVFGPLYTIQAALPGLRARKSGTIVNLSSVGGQDAQASCGLYAGSKFFLEGISESLAREVEEFGITVLIVEPGAFRTNFLNALVLNEKGVPEAYENTAVHETVKKFGMAAGKQPGDPGKAANAIFEVVTGEGEAGKLKGQIRRLVLGKDAYTRIERKINDVRKDLDVSKDIIFSTDVSE